MTVILSEAKRSSPPKRSRLFRAAMIAGACAAALSVGLAVYVALPLPKDTLALDATRGVTIEDRNGIVLRNTRADDGSNARWVKYDQIDPDLINAFVAVEDRRFWDHHGIDATAVARAVRDNARARRVVSGASTITMQLARLLHPANRRFEGKITQALFALRLDAHLSKRQILEQYLNRVELGQGTIGVAAASALYFDTSPNELSIGQAATIAGLAHAPSRDNPQTSLKRARARRTVALERMHRLAFITREEITRATMEPLVSGIRNAPFLAPHFTTRVLAWTEATRDSLRSDRIRTSLDAGLQSELEAEVAHTVAVLGDRGVGEAAAVVLSNATGEVVAWVGSPDFWNSEHGQTDMVLSPRQPGSALKPFLYALAFDHGVTAATILPDLPKSYATSLGAYRPRDYDRRFRGPVRAREALASSFNVPAVELASQLGASSLLQTLRLAGFSSLSRDADFYGLGLALGDGDVSLLELANGYRALANGGVWHAWTWRPVAQGARIGGEARRVASPAASAIVLDILDDPAARMPGFGFDTPFDFPFPVAVKTGTSRHFTDNWAVGTTAGFTVAVWAGNFNGHPMQGVSGVTGAGPLLHRAVMAAAKRIPPGALTTPTQVGAVSVPVCRLSGMKATPSCARVNEWFIPGTEPTHFDDWERDGHVTLPAEYSEWAQGGMTRSMAERPLAVAASPEPTRPLAVDTIQNFRMLSPLDGDRYTTPPGVDAKYATIPLRATGPGSSRVEWVVDGQSFDGARWSLAPGSHVITAKSARGTSVSARITVDR
ncbi:MAG TPA: penicillin-binding protein 1C [Gemmatimonadaceae bacterium]